MAFLGGIVNRIVKEFNSIKNSVIQTVQKQEQSGPSVAQQIQQQYGDVSPSSSGIGRDVRFTLYSRTAEAEGLGTASLTVFFNKEIQQSILRDIGETGVRSVREWLAPIRRTGELESSFRYRIDLAGQSVTIFSTLPQASSIARGISTTGSQDRLITWLRSKSEHASKSEKELKRTAFLIQRSINTGKQPGPQSTLRSLTPIGTRSYNYLGLVEQDIEKYVQQMIDESWARMD